jgi:hypothetical protein
MDALSSVAHFESTADEIQEAETDFLVPVEPVAAADRVVTLTTDSVRNVILACYIVSSFLASRPTKMQMKRFTDRLVECRFMSHRDGNAPLRENGKLSMLNNIGKLKDVFLDPRILPYLTPDYSTLYQVGRRYKLIAFDIDRLQDDLAALPADYTRDDLAKSNALVKASIDANRNAINPPPDLPALAFGKDADGGATSLVSSQPVDLLVAEPDRSDLTRLKKDYVEADALDWLLPRPTVAQHAALVIIIRLGDLGVVERTLLPHLGFDQFRHLILLSDISTVDIVSLRVALVAIRGSRECSIRAPGVRRPGVSAHAIAEALFPGSQNRAAFFTAQSPGWSAISWTSEA